MEARGQGALVGNTTPPWFLQRPGPCPQKVSKKMCPQNRHSGDFWSQNGSVLGSHMDSK